MLLACNPSASFSSNKNMTKWHVTPWQAYPPTTREVLGSIPNITAQWKPTKNMAVFLKTQSTNDSGIQKQHCRWLLVTHRPCVKDDVVAALKGATSNAVLKFEPFILHVQCRTLQDAQTLHSVAIESGFRNSGITVGKRGKTMLAVRSTHGLEVPLSHKGKLMVTEEYIEFLLTIANQKMEENKKRIERFYSCLQHALERKATSSSHSEIQEKNNALCTHKTNRNQGKARDPSVTEDYEKELEGDDGLGISAAFLLEDD
ncbi:tRNA wybutosine-synthesizing protein 3 homolog isoform X1 [Mesocricetus auratus]|uniref:tRNA wybutosine-synthesizing protein 3 homolog n=1 Tax=Mesocricetus auratus TaxID=10036 RepID=A0ABM2Y0Q5_MESAU|nr:tRNA wybutosine-synthesizing protein 3 homolog isoform X1 [Mesocricetus auratus]